MTRRAKVIILAAVIPFGVQATAATFPLRTGWILAPIAQDLIQAADWSCLPVSIGPNNVLTVPAQSGYVNAWLNEGPLLQVTGDFSVLATFANTNSGGLVDLVAQWAPSVYAPSPPYPQGFIALEAGIGGNFISVNYLDGSASPPPAMSFALPPGSVAPVTLEIARIGSQFVLFANGQQAGVFNDPGIFNSGNVFYGFTVFPQQTMTVTGLAAAVPSSSPTDAVLYYPYKHAAKRTGTALRDLAGPSGFPVGANGVFPYYFIDPNYAEILGREFDMMGPALVMEFNDTEPSPGVYTFCDADKLVDYAQANGMTMRGGHLVYSDPSLPQWLSSGTFSRDQGIGIMQDHINTLMTRYKGKVREWEVVAEAVEDGLMKFWPQTIGSDYIDLAFQFAREADPSAELYYADYGGEGLGPKSDAIYNLVQGMLSRGVPIDGVGLEMHVDQNMQIDNTTPATTPPLTAQSIAANIQRLTALGLKVEITEMDVRLPLPATAGELATQATDYQTVLSTCVSNPNCAFLTWDVSDADSWIPIAFPGFGAATLFDAQFQPKPAYGAVAAVLAALKPEPPQPQISAGGVVIHASTSTTVSPGCLFDIYGTNLGPSPITAPAGSPVLQSTLGGVSVIVDGIPAPLLYVGPNQIVGQIPGATATGTASVVVVNGISSAAASVTVQPAAPWILTYGTNRAVVQNQDFSLNSSSNPAQVGSYGVAYLMGSGPTKPAVADGTPAPVSPPSKETLATTVTVGGAQASVSFAGMAPGFVGLVQVNFQVPNLPAGDYAIRVTIGSTQSNSPIVTVGH
jgi:endo-1,4-beta-xylanase